MSATAMTGQPPSPEPYVPPGWLEMDYLPGDAPGSLAAYEQRRIPGLLAIAATLKHELGHYPEAAAAVWAIEYLTTVVTTDPPVTT